jgi:hypothetical protein
MGATRGAALAALLACAWGCSCPRVNVGKYFPRDTPASAVRYFQLALELEMWSEAAACLSSAEEDISSWKLWALCDRRVPELGDFSLREVVAEVYWVNEDRVREGDAVVSVLSRPAPGVDQLYHLMLRKKSGAWQIDLDATFRLNV